MPDRPDLRRIRRDQSEVVPMQNDEASSMPAYACAQIDSYSAPVYSAVQPDGTGNLFYANGEIAVGAGKRGSLLLWNRPRQVLLASDAAVGDIVGPVAGSWEMTTSGTGFVVFRIAASGVGVVEKVGGGSVSIRHAIVREQLGDGYYRVEIAEWSGTGETGSVGSSASGDINAGVCPTDGPDSGSGISGAECTIDAPTPGLHVAGLGDPEVLAYHSQSAVVPLKVGTSCKVVDMGDTTAGAGSSASSSSGASGDESVWQILDGFQEHIVIEEEEWECCPSTGNPLLVAKTNVIVAGIRCDRCVVAECPPDSGSSA